MDSDLNKLRDLVDSVWNAATDSGQVPDTRWADEIINAWKKRHESLPTKGADHG